MDDMFGVRPTVRLRARDGSVLPIGEQGNRALACHVPKASILAHQTSAEDAGRVAQQAGVKTLVLSHFVPPDDPEVTDATWREAASRHSRGTVIVGRDLLEV